MSNSPRAFVQQLNRVRETVTNSYELFIKEDLTKKQYFIKYRRNVSIGKGTPWYDTINPFSIIL